ncbi:MAG: hypothetical protein ABUS57_13660 [Pseudomonadota bacterium]
MAQWDTEVADDLSDAKGLGKLMWFLVALLRFATAGAVAVIFFVTLLLLSARYQADNAIAGGTAQGIAQLSQTNGGLGVSDVADATKIANAQAAEAARVEWAAASQVEADHLARRDALGSQIQVLARRAAACGQEPNLDQSLRCSPAQDSTVHAEFAQTLANYDVENKALLEVSQQVQDRFLKLQEARRQPGASLAGAIPAIEARDSLVTALPACVRPVADWFFNLPLLISSVTVSFLAGMFGAVAILLVLLAYPTYAPLTFGGGKYFFLRMFTGGFVAVLIFVAIQSGVTVAGLADLQSLSSSGGGDPIKVALLGVFAGAFSEQIAGAVKGYVDSAFHGGVDTSVPPDEPPTGAMGPGAASGQV